MFSFRSFWAATGLLIFAGCVSYTPQKLDLDRLSPDNTVVFTPDFHYLPELALLLNPEINRLRLELARNRKEADATGWWEDPALGFDLLRILSPDDSKWLGGASLSFTLPLTGIPGLEKHAAELYTEANAARLRDAEARLLADVRSAQVELWLRSGIVNALSSQQERLEKLLADAEKLAALGEVDALTLHGLRRSRRENRAALTQAKQEFETARYAVVEYLGVISVENVWLDVPELHLLEAPIMPEIGVETFHPAIEVLLLEHGKTEVQLRAEIRGQYPNLEIGPAWSREEGKNRIGVGGGITLPLWNRNRKAIAEAETARELAAFDVRVLWKNHLLQQGMLKRQREYLQNLSAEQEALAREAEQNAADAGKLYTLGEIGLPDYLDAATAALETRLAADEACAALLVNTHELIYLNTSGEVR